MTQKLLDQETDYQLPRVVWQDNTAPQTWLSLEDFGNQTDHKTFSLGTEEAVIENHYQDSDFERFGKTYQPLTMNCIKGKSIR